MLDAGSANWDLALLASLLVFSIVSDLSAATTSAAVKISGSFYTITAEVEIPQGVAEGMLILDETITGFRWSVGWCSRRCRAGLA